MTKDYAIKPVTQEDKTAVIDILNYYIEHSFAAYPENPMPYEAFDRYLQMTKGYPFVTVRNEEDYAIGFGFIRGYSPLPTFSHTAQITYFIHHDYISKGIGTMLMSYLLSVAKEIGITNMLAHISSRNEISIKFHEKHGFAHCGRLKEIGNKKGQNFDVIYMQKFL